MWNNESWCTTATQLLIVRIRYRRVFWHFVVTSGFKDNTALCCVRQTGILRFASTSSIVFVWNNVGKVTEAN